MLALLLAHVVLDLGVDALAHLQDLAAANHLGEDQEHPGLHVERAEELGLLGHAARPGGRRRSRPARPARADGVDLRAELRGEPELIHDLVHRVPEVQEQGVELFVARRRVSGAGPTLTFTSGPSVAIASSLARATPRRTTTRPPSPRARRDADDLRRPRRPRGDRPSTRRPSALPALPPGLFADEDGEGRLRMGDAGAAPAARREGGSGSGCPERPPRRAVRAAAALR